MKLGSKVKTKAKVKDSRCQGQIFHRSFYIVLFMFMFCVSSSRIISCLNCILSVYEYIDMLLLLMTIDKEECQTPKR